MFKIIKLNRIPLRSVERLHHKMGNSSSKPFNCMNNVNYYSTTNVNLQNSSSFNMNNNNGASIDEEELKKFQKLSQTWWTESGEFEALRRFNSIRVPWISNVLTDYYRKTQLNSYTPEQIAQEPLIGLNVLDVGCGGGILAEPLAKLGAQVTAIDMVRENIIVAQNHLNSYKNNESIKFTENIKYINCALEDLVLSDKNFGYFDAIVMSEVIEHVSNVDTFVKNASLLLKNNGFLFITTLNRTLCSYLAAIIGAEYVMGIVPKGTHDWNKFIAPDEIKNHFIKNNIITKSLNGITYNPVFKYWSWISNTNVNYAMYGQKIKK